MSAGRLDDPGLRRLRAVLRERLEARADLAARSGVGGPVAVVEHAAGAPLRDRPAERVRQAA